MGIISGLGSFRGRFGDHFRVGDHFGVGIISGAVQTLLLPNPLPLDQGHRVALMLEGFLARFHGGKLDNDSCGSAFDCNSADEIASHSTRFF